MALFMQYRLRFERKKWLFRAFRKRRELQPIVNRAGSLMPSDLLLFATIRNERIRLPYFFKYYRAIGINHFFFVDNNSDDGTREYLTAQPDVSLWTTKSSYKRARFGMDWMNWLLKRYAHGHWALVVDPDEFFVYPFCDTRPLRALTDWLDAGSIKSFSTMTLDMYPKGPIINHPYYEGQNPFETASWFDSGNYIISKNKRYGNLWIQGGARARMFFADIPERSPALNKIPLVKWHRDYVYISSTHMMLPRGLNLTYEEWGGEKTSGCLLHAKFLDFFAVKAQEEMSRKQHYANSHEYRVYKENMENSPDLWCSCSEQYINWRQLEILGLLSKGNWA